MANNLQDRRYQLLDQFVSTAWFNQGEFYWRTGASFAWSLLMLPVAVFVYNCLVLVDFYHPLTWIAGCASSVFDDNVWLYMILFMWLVVPVMLGHFKLCSVKSVVDMTRLQCWLGLLTPPRFFYIPLCGACGLMSMWCCVSLLSGPYTFLSLPCTMDQQMSCLNEHHLFLVLLGGWTGILYGFNYFWSKEFLLDFPLLKQERFFRVKASLPGCIWKSLTMSVRICLSFYIVYFMFGHYTRQWAIDSGGIALDSSTASLTSFSGLVDLYLFWIALSSSTLILFLWFLSNKLFNIFNTQNFRFPVEASFNEDKNKMLASSLQTTNSPLLQYLAFMDLCQLALFSPRRRKQIFCLSQPGGHPVTWKVVSTECLKVLKYATLGETQYREYKNGVKMVDTTLQTDVSLVNHQTTLNQSNYYGSPVDSPHIKQTVTGYGTPVSNLTRRTFDSTMLTPNRTLEVKTPLPYSPNDTNSALHNNTTLGRKDLKNNPNLLDNNNPPHYESMTDRMIKALRKTPFLAYFIGELPEASSQQMFIDFPVQMWAVEGLSRLVVASFTEDSFGVVQKDLAQILTSMLELLQALDKNMKLSVLNTKSPLYSQPALALPKSTEHHLLRECVKSALYRITNTFHSHLGAINLEPGVKLKLELFTEHKE